MIVDQVKQSKLGMIEFKVNPESFILSKVGLKSFDNEKLKSNFDSLLTALLDRKPESIKQRYFLKGMVKTTMSPPLKVDLSHYSALASA
jgi:large subunit ribosomal protein L1